MIQWFNIYQHRRLYWSRCIFCPIVVAKRLNCALSLFWTWQRLSLSGWMFWLEGRGTLSILIQWGQKMHKHNRPQWKYRYAESKGENTWKHHVQICNYSVTRGISSVLWNLKSYWCFMNHSKPISAPLTPHWHQSWLNLEFCLATPLSPILPKNCGLTVRFFFWISSALINNPANPCNMSKMFGAKTQAIASIWAKMFHCTNYIIRSWSPGYYTYQHTLVQQRPGLPDAAHLVETVPVPSHDDVGAVPLAPAAEANAVWIWRLWRPARQAKSGQTNLPKDLQSSSEDHLV